MLVGTRRRSRNLGPGPPAVRVDHGPQGETATSSARQPANNGDIRRSRVVTTYTLATPYSKPPPTAIHAIHGEPSRQRGRHGSRLLRTGFLRRSRVKTEKQLRALVDIGEFGRRHPTEDPADPPFVNRAEMIDEGT